MDDLRHISVDADDSRVPGQPVLDYQPPASQRAQRAGPHWAELRSSLLAAGPGCLVVLAVIIIMLVYGTLMISVLSGG